MTAKVEQHLITYQKEAFQPFHVEEITALVITDDPEISFTYAPVPIPAGSIETNTVAAGSKNTTSTLSVTYITEKNFSAPYILAACTKWNFRVRNPVHSTKAFSLPTSADRFYPDFSCKLRDGRYLVVEFKGADRYDNLGQVERRQISAIWEMQSEGQCLVIMAKDWEYSAINNKFRWYATGTKLEV